MATNSRSPIKGKRPSQAVVEDFLPLDEASPEVPASVKRHCAECGTVFTKTVAHQRYCSKPCKDAATSRAKTRGASLYRDAYSWRKLSRSNEEEDRKDAGYYFARLTRAIDAMIQEDLANGRKAPLPPED